MKYKVGSLIRWYADKTLIGLIISLDPPTKLYRVLWFDGTNSLIFGFEVGEVINV